MRTLSMPLRFGSVLFNALSTMDALDDAAPPEEPAWPAAGSPIESARAEAMMAHFDGEEPLSPALSAAEKRAWSAYAKQREKWRATKSASRKKVLGFKFQSNDGWVVARSEAAVIAKAIEALLADDDAFELLMDILDVGRGAEKGLRAALSSFQKFNAKCAAREGYTVW